MLNKVILMGRLTADPELRQTQSGVNSCRFTVAVDRNFVPQGGERQADFITCIAWRQTAEFVSRYFSKGRMICVEGSIRTGSYVDKRYSDVTHYTTEVYADRVYFTGEKATGNQQGGTYAPQQYSQPQYSQQPQYNQQAPAQSAPAPSISVGDLRDYEEVIGDGGLPF